MPSFFHSRMASADQQPEVSLPRPAPAQRRLTEQIGIADWNRNVFDFKSIEADEARLQGVLAGVDQAAQYKRPVTADSVVPRLAVSTAESSSGYPTVQQGKQPQVMPTSTKLEAHPDVIQQRQAEARRRTALYSQNRSPSPTPSPTPSTRSLEEGVHIGRLEEELSRLVAQLEPVAPEQTSEPAMRKSGLLAASPVADSCSAPGSSAQAPATPARYPARVPRWLDPHKVEMQLAEREMEGWVPKTSGDLWEERVKAFTRAVDGVEASNDEPPWRQTSRGEDPRTAATAGRPHPTSRSNGAGVVFGGEHPAAAYARHLATQDYRRRNAAEPDLVHPDDVPIDVSWQERTYSGRAVGAAWVKLEEERGQHEPIRTSAVPRPLNLRTGSAGTTSSDRQFPGPLSPSHLAYQQTDPWSYCHVARENLPGVHVRSMDRGCSCQYSSVAAQREQTESQYGHADDLTRTSAPPLDVGNAGQPRVHFYVPPHPRHNNGGYATDDGAEDTLSRAAQAPPQPYRGSTGQKLRPWNHDRYAARDSDSSDSDILGPARARVGRYS